MGCVYLEGVPFGLVLWQTKWTHACTHARTHTRTHACMHTHTHAHTHTHTLKLPMVQSTMMAVSWMNPGPMAINFAYDRITQKCWCLFRSPCLRNFLPQAQLSALNSDCLLAEQVFHHLDVEIFSTPSKHR